MAKTYFTADLHIGHANILKYHPARIEGLGLDPGSPTLLRDHDRRLLEIWNDTVKPQDNVYILGDMFWAGYKPTYERISQFNGHKFLVLGNHDNLSEEALLAFDEVHEGFGRMFCNQDTGHRFYAMMSHYAMLVWDRRHYGSVMLHGHSHGMLDDFNRASGELRVDVGIDGALARYNLVSLEDIYNLFEGKGLGEKRHDMPKQTKLM